MASSEQKNRELFLRLASQHEPFCVLHCHLLCLHNPSTLPRHVPIDRGSRSSVGLRSEPNRLLEDPKEVRTKGKARELPDAFDAEGCHLQELLGSLDAQLADV